VPAAPSTVAMGLRLSHKSGAATQAPNATRNEPF